MNSLLPQLVIMVDDSKSMDYLGAASTVQKDLELLQENEELNSKFEIQSFQFSDVIQPLDSLGFNQSDTDIGKAIEQPQELFKNRNKLSSFLQTVTRLVETAMRMLFWMIKPVCIQLFYGDTTSYSDVQITTINVNRYSYLNNEFPVEVFVAYQGTEEVILSFTVTQGTKTLHKESFSFDAKKRAAIASFNLTSTSVGTQSMLATIQTLSKEKNTKNNYRSFAVEVIDQQTSVLLLSDQLHPDIGVLKKAIESNQQRKVTIKNTSDSYDFNEYNLVVMYGVSSAFAKAYTQKDQWNKNTWIITGVDPDLNYMNANNPVFQIEASNEMLDQYLLEKRGIIW